MIDSILLAEFLLLSKKTIVLFINLSEWLKGTEYKLLTTSDSLLFLR